MPYPPFPRTVRRVSRICRTPSPTAHRDGFADCGDHPRRKPDHFLVSCQRYSRSRQGRSPSDWISAPILDYGQTVAALDAAIADDALRRDVRRLCTKRLLVFDPSEPPRFDRAMPAHSLARWSGSRPLVRNSAAALSWLGSTNQSGHAGQATSSRSKKERHVGCLPTNRTVRHNRRSSDLVRAYRRSANRVQTLRMTA
jgi:hypothetical protein